MCNAGSGRPSQSCGDGWELRVMIEIEVQKNKYAYNVYHLVKAFFPGEEVVQKINGKQETLAAIRMPEGSCFSIAPEGTNPDAGDVRDIQREKREVTRRVYRILSDYTGRKLAWGMLTGVRPTKLAMQRLEKETEAGGHPGVDAQERVVSYLEEEYFVSREKAVLAYQVARREQELLSRLDCRNGFSLYAGIPFCPSVCSYCSFSSSPLEKWKDRVDAYLDALIKEIRALSKMAAGRRPDTVYIGGGTPTTLEPEQLERLLGSLSEAFDLEGALEFTVEAGRPDSITEEKLAVLKQYPVSRISINPQTMQQKTLDLVGRRHTVQQTADDPRACREKRRRICGIPFSRLRNSGRTVLPFIPWRLNGQPGWVRKAERRICIRRYPGWLTMLPQAPPEWGWFPITCTVRKISREILKMWDMQRLTKPEYTIY